MSSSTPARERVIRTRLEFLLYALSCGRTDRVTLPDAIAFQPGMLASNAEAFDRATTLARDFAREHVPDLMATDYGVRTVLAESGATFTGAVAFKAGGKHVRIVGEDGKLVAYSSEPVTLEAA